MISIVFAASLCCRDVRVQILKKAKTNRIGTPMIRKKNTKLIAIRKTDS